MHRLLLDQGRQEIALEVLQDDIGIAELLALRPEGSSMVGAILGLTARPLIEALMQLARTLGEDARTVLRAWTARRWD